MPKYVSEDDRLKEMPDESQTAVLGESFVAALTAQQFETIETLFAPQARFRALVPSRVCEGHTPAQATAWLQRWFGSADEVQVLQSTAQQVFDRLYVSYRVRLHDVINGWRVIEQHAYGSVQDDRIADLWLLCSGFRPDDEGRAASPLHCDFVPGVKHDRSLVTDTECE
jgi:hypothetical protein